MSSLGWVVLGVTWVVINLVVMRRLYQTAQRTAERSRALDQAQPQVGSALQVGLWQLRAEADGGRMPAEAVLDYVAELEDRLTRSRREYVELMQSRPAQQPLRIASMGFMGRPHDVVN